MNERHESNLENNPASPQGARTTGKASRRPARNGADMPNLISTTERETMIATAAYYRAECRGFAPGQEIEDWVEAEAEIDRQLGRD